MNPESEVNTQVIGSLSDVKHEGTNEVVMEQVTEKVKEKNSQIIEMDKVKGLFSSEMNAMKFRAYEFGQNVKRIFENLTWSKAAKFTSTAALGFILASCSATQSRAMVVPQERTQEAQQTAEALNPTLEATLSPEEIREQRIDKIIKVVEANPNTFTVEELDTYLQENGTNWIGSVQDWIDRYEVSNMPFKYFFVRDNYKESGVLLSPSPYRHSREMTMNDKNSLPTPVVVEEEVLDKKTESIYDNLFFENSDGSFGWDKEPGKYTVIIYINKDTDSEGKPVDYYYFSIGGYSFDIPTIDTATMKEDMDIKYISLEEIYNRDLSDEQIGWLEQAIEYLPSGYTEFTLDKEGNIIEASANFKELNLKSPSTLSDSTDTETPSSEEEISQTERDRILDKFDNSFTVDELDSILVRWQSPLIDYVNEAWKEARKLDSAFLYYFGSQENGGSRFGPKPYGLAYGSLKQWMGKMFDQDVVDEKLFNRMAAAFSEQFLDRSKTGTPEALLWDPAEEYTTVFYVVTVEDEYGKLTIAWPDSGGVYKIISDTEVLFIPLKDLKNTEWSADELKLLDNKCMVLDYRFGDKPVGRGNVDAILEQMKQASGTNTDQPEE